MRLGGIEGLECGKFQHAQQTVCTDQRQHHQRGWQGFAGAGVDGGVVGRNLVKLDRLALAGALADQTFAQCVLGGDVLALAKTVVAQQTQALPLIVCGVEHRHAGLDQRRHGGGDDVGEDLAVFLLLQLGRQFGHVVLHPAGLLGLDHQSLEGVERSGDGANFVPAFQARHLDAAVPFGQATHQLGELADRSGDLVQRKPQRRQGQHHDGDHGADEKVLKLARRFGQRLQALIHQGALAAHQLAGEFGNFGEVGTGGIELRFARRKHPFFAGAAAFGANLLQLRHVWTNVLVNVMRESVLQGFDPSDLRAVVDHLLAQCREGGLGPAFSAFQVGQVLVAGPQGVATHGHLHVTHGNDEFLLGIDDLIGVQRPLAGLGLLNGPLKHRHQHQQQHHQQGAERKGQLGLDALVSQPASGRVGCGFGVAHDQSLSAASNRHYGVGAMLR